MGPADMAERLAEAHRQAILACQLLVSPSAESLERCHGALQEAVAQLAPSQASSGRAAADLLERTRQLRAQIQRAGQLLKSAGLFYRGWKLILGTMSGGYTASGEPAPIPPLGKFSWRG